MRHELAAKHRVDVSKIRSLPTDIEIVPSEEERLAYARARGGCEEIDEHILFHPFSKQPEEEVELDGLLSRMTFLPTVHVYPEMPTKPEDLVSPICN